MSNTTCSSAFVLALALISCFITHQATAHFPHQLTFPINPSIQPGKPGWAVPSLHNPSIPPHFLPYLPFPGMQGMPSMPTMPYMPSDPAFPSLPSVPSTFPSLPSGPAFPSTPDAPPPPPPPATPREIPPAFPEPSAKLIENAPGTRMSP